MPLSALGSVCELLTTKFRIYTSVKQKHSMKIQRPKMDCLTLLR